MRTIRPLRQGDLDDVLRIENSSFSCPWPAEAFKEMPFTESFVICEDGRLAGYIMFHNVIDESVIINLAIDPDCRRRGFAEELLRDTLQGLIERGFNRFFLDVRASNLAAQNLYLKFGFAARGRRKAYYSQPDEDAIIMVKTIDGEQL